jgi:hypothetical protein
VTILSGLILLVGALVSYRFIPGRASVPTGSPAREPVHAQV